MNFWEFRIYLEFDARFLSCSFVPQTDRGEHGRTKPNEFSNNNFFLHSPFPANTSSDYFFTWFVLYYLCLRFSALIMIHLFIGTTVSHWTALFEFSFLRHRNNARSLYKYRTCNFSSRNCICIYEGVNVWNEKLWRILPAQFAMDVFRIFIGTWNDFLEIFRRMSWIRVLKHRQ